VIAAAERVVSDLNIARTTDAEVGDIDEAQALRELLDCAKEMRKACDAVFGNPRLTNVLNVPLMRGVIKNWDRSKNSEEEFRNSLREIIALDFFSRFGRRMVIYLDCIINASQFSVNAMDGSSRIEDTDYFYTAVFAYNWWKLLGIRPTTMNLDKDLKGTTFEPTLFQEFLTALPLTGAINEETVRTVVAFVREFPLRAEPRN
jgi:hypothetical protein